MHNDDLLRFLKERDYAFKPDFSGEFVRFDRGGKVLNGWAKGETIKIGDKVAYKLRFGDWARGETHEWQSDTSDIDPEALEAALRESRQRDDAEKRARQELASGAALDRWEAAIDRAASHPYLTKKGLTRGLYGCKIDIQTGALLVPMTDIHGRLWALQEISKDGDKKFQPGGRIKGCLHALLPAGQVLTERLQTDRIFIAEGLATAASIFEATGAPTICSFTAGNLPHVAAAIREAYPECRITICADNDQWTTGTDNRPYNPGLQAAQKAAELCAGDVRYPVFTDLNGKPTDFNDIHAREGLDRVRELLAAQPEASPEPQGYIEQDLEAQGAGVKKTVVISKKTMPTEAQIVRQLIDGFGQRLVKQGKDIFAYDGRKWVFLDQNDLDKIKARILALYGYVAKSKDVESAFKTMLYLMPATPKGVNLYAPPRFVANFQNGTLVVDKKNLDQPFLFREHKPEDWLIHVLPFDYDENWLSRDWQSLNPEFAAMLERVFEGDPDKDDKTRALSQMYGACLLPSFPHLFFLYGPPGTGKSTAMKLAARLVDNDNLCSVQPKAFKGFGMETMPGKLVNMDTDVDTNAPITDDVLKKIEDQTRIRIERKGLKDVNAPLPATHIFGGNEIPKTLDGISKAHDRRWTFLEFSKVVAKGDYDRDYADYCFEQGPGGILNFALRGLLDIVRLKGKFTQPASGQAKMKAWQMQTDVVGQFLQDIEEGEVLDNRTQVTLSVNAKIERGRLYEIFTQWAIKAGQTGARYFPNRRFFATMRQKGYLDYPSHGKRYFGGVGVECGEEAGF